MRINDRIGWSVFTYDLLYPGILGSMLYDIVQCFREFGYARFIVNAEKRGLYADHSKTV